MIKSSNINGTLLKVTFVITILLIASCNNNKNPEDPKVVAEERNDDKFDNKRQVKDVQFLVNAAETNLEEIQLGRLAQQKGSLVHVKELGKMMEDAHTKSQRELAALADRKTIAIPTSLTDDTKDAYEKLNEKTGNDFDKAYADLMVSRHKDAIDTYEKVYSDASDSDIKNWARASLPDLRKHLEHSIECKRKCDEI